MPATADLTGFRRAFPELAERDDAEVTEVLEAARRLDRRRPRLTLLAAAHLLILQDGDPRGGSGEARRRRLGPVGATYRSQAEVTRHGGSRDAYWTSTVYGRRYLILSQRRRFW